MLGKVLPVAKGYNNGFAWKSLEDNREYVSEAEAIEISFEEILEQKEAELNERQDF